MLLYASARVKLICRDALFHTLRDIEESGDGSWVGRRLDC